MRRLSHGRTNAEMQKKLSALAAQNELPVIVKKIMGEVAQGYDAASEFKNEELIARIEESKLVLKKVAELAKEVSLDIIQGALKNSVGQGDGAYGFFESIADFEGGFFVLNRKARRVEFWGTQWQLPCFVVNALISDMLSGIDVNNPSKEDLLRSELMNVLATFGCPKDKLEEFIKN